MGSQPLCLPMGYSGDQVTHVRISAPKRCHKTPSELRSAR
jgi:hypothetical protein